MGGCQSIPNKSEKERSDEIDKQIEEDAKKFKKECKILLLGACAAFLACISAHTFRIGSGESGKSTIVKQMKIIHQNGYTRDELLVFRLVVYDNLIESAQAIVKQMRKMGVDPEVPENRVRTADHDAL